MSDGELSVDPTRMLAQSDQYDRDGDEFTNTGARLVAGVDSYGPFAGDGEIADTFNGIFYPTLNGIRDALTGIGTGWKGIGKGWSTSAKVTETNNLDGAEQASALPKSIRE